MISSLRAKTKQSRLYGVASGLPCLFAPRNDGSQYVHEFRSTRSGIAGEPRSGFRHPALQHRTWTREPVPRHIRCVNGYVDHPSDSIGRSDALCGLPGASTNAFSLPHARSEPNGLITLLKTNDYRFGPLDRIRSADDQDDLSHLTRSGARHPSG